MEMNKDLIKKTYQIIVGIEPNEEKVEKIWTELPEHYTINPVGYLWSREELEEAVIEWIENNMTRYKVRKIGKGKIVIHAYYPKNPKKPTRLPLQFSNLELAEGVCRELVKAYENI